LDAVSAKQRWIGTGGLSLVHELNERSLELIAEIARSEPAGGEMPAAITLNRALWRNMDRPMLQRAAQSPLLLLDVNFSNEQWWRSAIDDAVVERKTASGTRGPRLPPRIAAELAHEAIFLAWTLTRFSGVRVTGLLCGMTPGVAHLFSTLGVQDAERIASRHGRHVRLRHDDHPAFWRSLLRAAGGSSLELGTTNSPLKYGAGYQHSLF
jgi:hypothetical protein